VVDVRANRSGTLGRENGVRLQLTTVHNIFMTISSFPRPAICECTRKLGRILASQ